MHQVRIRWQPGHLLTRTHSPVTSLAMAVEEAVANVIRHGYADGEPHVITVRLACDGGQWIAEVVDDGVSFDPTARVPDNGGFHIGLLLIKTMVDEIEYIREADCNRLRMIKSSPRSRMPPP